ncbi:nuclease PIN [Chryseobacterium artocarpi]|uniref:Nuclease PIN n=2 Tax=Weeksellaceae TaxID=2762318 RepID=A0A1B9A171_9FLAO|nr:MULTISPECIES: pirin family protein [Weeksellaceae]MDV3568017.1 nuclease PIN [Elizabethkingia anophelis]MDV3752478.1 nuclease PIN [Elizabethkingia anophelis]MDV3877144.1 nuclease PIN [Elizabethkingia anophelis]MDV3969651.1 nuclease PIN [Elizabethkingia anophelis]OCA77562.1 nuclease PIN [Chryseobacterium artocarpi]
MLKKIDNSKKLGNQHISILYPGLELSDSDTGYYSIGRIDQAHIQGGAVIKMHPHVNDDILSYFRSGKVKHTDSEGFTEYITPTKLMLMKAGKMFYHEEAILEEQEGLQIFIRPGEKDSQPEVIFQELEEVHSINEWRLIASPDKSKTVLELSSQTWIYDMQITPGKVFSLPEEVNKEFHCLLYVFQGSMVVNDNIELGKGESIFIKDEIISFQTSDRAELVLFVTDTKSPYYDGGMYSGNQK